MPAIDSAFLAAMTMLYPIVFRVAVRLVPPDYFAILNKRLKGMSLVIVPVLGILGNGVGEISYRFPTRSRYAIDGDDFPADCADG